MLKLLKTWIRSLFCTHRYEWFRNIYGDEIIYSGYKRSLWRCRLCGRWRAEEYLHDPRRTGQEKDIRGFM